MGIRVRPTGWHGCLRITQAGWFGWGRPASPTPTRADLGNRGIRAWWGPVPNLPYPFGEGQVATRNSEISFDTTCTERNKTFVDRAPSSPSGPKRRPSPLQKRSRQHGVSRFVRGYFYLGKWQRQPFRQKTTSDTHMLVCVVHFTEGARPVPSGISSPTN